MQFGLAKQNLAHDVFICYSRRDSSFARSLEKALSNFTLPKGLPSGQRRLRVFRDENDFTGIDYYKAIDRHLTASAKLVVLCSPEARRSDFVNDEIRRFRVARGADNIVPVLVAGVPNNEAGPGRESELAFPEALCEAIEMPLAASFLGLNVKKDRLDRGVFYASWYLLLSNILEVSRSDIEQRVRRRKVRSRAITLGLVALVVVALSVALVFALVSRQQAVAARTVAEANEARARRLYYFTSLKRLTLECG
jgi:hypothetical protein